MSTYTRMQTFVAVIQENSFNQAAAKLNTSAAEVSRRISALESELKVKLINRTTRKLTLTKLGEIYYEDCKCIIQAVDAANHKILSQQEEPTGTLTVHYFTMTDLLPILPNFIKQYPKITLKLIRAEVIPDFSNKDLDITIGLTEDAPIPENCVRKKIGMSHYTLCCSPQYLKSSKPIKKPADLSGHQYITHTGRTGGDTEFFKTYLSIHLPPYLYMNDSEEMIKAATAHMGIILIHADRVQEQLKNKQLVHVLPDYALPTFNRYIIYPYDRYLERKIRVFLDCFDQ
jgi:DNA-binding transcriptional LysR family regulator